MAQSINLIPQEEQQEQQKTKVVRVSTIFSIIVLIVVGLVSGYFYYSISVQKTTLKGLERDITGLRSNIKDLSEIEIVARNLDAKYKALVSIYSAKPYYSVLLEEFARRVPQSVTVTTLSIEQENTITISGTGTDYLAISDFVKSLKENKFDDASVNGIFSDVALNSVNLDKASGKAQYFIVIGYDGGKLKK